MAPFTGTITLAAPQLEALEAFIHEPDTRQSDIYEQGRLTVGDDVSVDWIIKHDLFEGVVLHISLMGENGTRFLAGEGAALSRAEDALKTFSLSFEDQTYRVTFESPP